VAFNISMMAFASGLASLVFHAAWLRGSSSVTPGLVLATAILFLGQTAPVATILSLCEGKSASPIWWSLAELSFPYYVVSAGVTSLLQTASSHMGWEVALAVFPVMYCIHRSYRRYFAKAVETQFSSNMVRAAGAGA
jgi:hypothetical protein